MTARPIVLAACVALAACEGSVSFVAGDAGSDLATDPAADTGIDASPDGEAEPVVDPPVDPIPDTGIDTGVDTAPPDLPADAPPDLPPDVGPDGGICVSEGCLLAVTGLSCCAGLSPELECSPSWPDCDADRYFCIDCGNGTCDPHENRYNCFADCSMGCGSDVAVSYACSPIETHSCFCAEPECRPECLASSAGDMAWVDPCTHERIRDADCADQHAVCDAIGSFSEGWYESETGELIDWALCAPEWSCGIVW